MAGPEPAGRDSAKRRAGLIVRQTAGLPPGAGPLLRGFGSGGTGARPNGLSPRVDASPEVPMVYPSWFMGG
jgi:hypothetical protein